MGFRNRIAEAVIAGDIDSIRNMVREALDEGLSAGEIINEGLLVGMQYVGGEFKEARMFIPEVLISAETMNRAMDPLRPHVMQDTIKSEGLVVIGTVEGDLHDIGKSLVCLMLESNGFEVVDLGIDVPAQHFVEAAREHRPDIVGMSALLTTTLPRMQEVIDAFAAEDLRGSVRIIVGGAPVTGEFADSIGADGYAPDAVSAVDLARSVIPS